MSSSEVLRWVEGSFVMEKGEREKSLGEFGLQLHHALDTYLPFCIIPEN